MRLLFRSEFSAITRVAPDTLKNLSRRGQLPFAIGLKVSGPGYTPFEAFLTIISQKLHVWHGVNLNRAADIAASIPEVLAPKWTAIVESAQHLVDGKKREEIVAGQCNPFGFQPPKPICGTAREIAEQLKLEGLSGAGWTTCSASAALTLLIQRCDRFDVAIDENFWTLPFSFRQRPSGAERMQEGMRRLLADEAVSEGE